VEVNCLEKKADFDVIEKILNPMTVTSYNGMKVVSVKKT
jgi:hypothetical protein